MTTTATLSANELRIGNWVKPIRARHGENYIQVTSLCDESVNMDFREYNISDLQPIPLTPEILEKAGFEKISDTYFHILSSELDYIFGINFTGMGWMAVNINTRGAIEYLHQLQNLYWCLTQTELKIDL